MSADIVAENGAIEGAVVRFYEGDPEKGGRIFDHEILPHIRAGESWPVSVPFWPDSCGATKIFIEASLQGEIKARDHVHLQSHKPKHKKKHDHK